MPDQYHHNPDDTTSRGRRAWMLAFLLVAVAVGGAAGAAFADVQNTDATDVRDAADRTVTPYENDPWYQVGMMPVVLTAVGIGAVVGVGVVARQLAA